MRKQEIIIFLGIIIFIGILFIGYIFVSFFSPQTSIKTSPSPRSSSNLRPFPSSSSPLIPPPQVILPSSLPQPSGQLTKQAFLNLFPVQTEFANIEYLSVSDSFAVTIKEDPYQINKEKVEKWFYDQGFNSSELKIYWDAYPEVNTQ